MSPYLIMQLDTISTTFKVLAALGPIFFVFLVMMFGVIPNSDKVSTIIRHIIVTVVVVTAISIIGYMMTPTSLNAIIASGTITNYPPEYIQQLQDNFEQKHAKEPR